MLHPDLAVSWLRFEGSVQEFLTGRGRSEGAARVAPTVDTKLDDGAGVFGVHGAGAGISGGYDDEDDDDDCTEQHFQQLVCQRLTSFAREREHFEQQCQQRQQQQRNATATDSKSDADGAGGSGGGSGGGGHRVSTGNDVTARVARVIAGLLEPHGPQCICNNTSTDRHFALADGLRQAQTWMDVFAALDLVGDGPSERREEGTFLPHAAALASSVVLSDLLGPIFSVADGLRRHGKPHTLHSCLCWSVEGRTWRQAATVVEVLIFSSQFVRSFVRSSGR